MVHLEGVADALGRENNTHHDMTVPGISQHRFHCSENLSDPYLSLYAHDKFSPDSDR